jgi:hypothetical protein
MTFFYCFPWIFVKNDIGILVEVVLNLWVICIVCVVDGLGEIVLGLIPF